MAASAEQTTGGGWFKTTHWSVVLDLATSDPARAQAALSRLCQIYWLPVYSFIRRSGRSPEDAEDLAQEFFARVVEKDYFKAAERERGKFRSFLLIVLKNFLASEWQRASRQKRGGGKTLISFEGLDTEGRFLAELTDEETPERAFDRGCAQALLEQVRRRLFEELASEGKEQMLEELRPYLTGEESAGSYPAAARRLGMSEGALRVIVHRLRRRYRELLRLEIAGTVNSPEAVDEEIRHLLTALA